MYRARDLSTAALRSYNSERRAPGVAGSTSASALNALLRHRLRVRHRDRARERRRARERDARDAGRRGERAQARAASAGRPRVFARSRHSFRRRFASRRRALASIGALAARRETSGARGRRARGVERARVGLRARVDATRRDRRWGFLYTARAYLYTIEIALCGRIYKPYFHPSVDARRATARRDARARARRPRASPRARFLASVAMSATHGACARAHDAANVPVLTLIALACVAGVAGALDPLVVTRWFLAYIVLDGLWIALWPRCVPSAAAVVVAHHVVTAALLAHPLRHPERAIETCRNGLVEANTLFFDIAAAGAAGGARRTRCGTGCTSRRWRRCDSRGNRICCGTFTRTSRRTTFGGRRRRCAGRRCF